MTLKKIGQRGLMMREGVLWLVFGIFSSFEARITVFRTCLTEMHTWGPSSYGYLLEGGTVRF